MIQGNNDYFCKSLIKYKVIMKETKHTSFDKNLYGLTTLIESGTTKFKSQGSGFYYNEMSPMDPNVNGGQWRKIEGTYLITNRHVALPKINECEVLPDYFVFNLREIVNNKVEWLPITLNKEQLRQRLLLHPDSGIDVVAIKVDDLIIDIAKIDPNRQLVIGASLSNDNLPSNSPLTIDVTSDIIVASYPRGFYDVANKFPIVKSGIISSGWGLNFNNNPIFLIDAQLFPGSSGGLVISKPINVAIIDGKLMHSNEKQFVFLGVYSGEPIQQCAPFDLGDLTIIRKNSYGLGTVWYSYLIPEIIANGLHLQELKKQ